MRHVLGLAVTALAAVGCASAGPETRDAYTVEITLRQADGTAVVSPRITFFAGQRANVSVVRPVTYAKDFDVEVVQDGFIADPVVETVDEGIWLEFRLAPAADAVDLAFEVKRSALSRRAVTPAGDVAPRVVTDAFSGTSRLATDVESELVSLPAHEGVESVVVYARVARVAVTEVEAAEHEDIGLDLR